MLVLLLMIVWPLAELFVAVKVAGAIGVLLTVVLLIASWPVGLWLVRAEGRTAWRRLRVASATGRPPGREVLDGALILIGGSLLIIPGFITDVIGLALLLGPTRALARVGLIRNLQSRLVRHATRFGAAGFDGPSGRRRARGRGDYDVESTATEINPASLPR